MKLSDELLFWRCERPSEYKMDEFIRQVQAMEREITTLKTKHKNN